MDNWDDLKFLVALSKAGTMAGAARMLGTNTATVSRRIDRLSDTLGQPAFVKTAEGWAPSDAAAALIQVAEGFDGALQTALNSQVGHNARTQLSIGAPPIVTAQVLFPGLAAHRTMLQGIVLSFADRIFNEGLGENDLVVQYGAPAAGRIVTRKAGELWFRLYAPRDWPVGSDWAGLSEEHDGYPTNRMGFDRFGGPPQLRVPNFSALHSLMASTGLPGPLPDLIAEEDTGFRQLDPGAEPFRAGFWLFYHESRRTDPALRRAVDWICRSFEDTALRSGSALRAV